MPFLTARWKYLAMFNYEVDVALLQPWLPPATEVDLFEGKALVSVVGFLFHDTRVLGLRWPGHVNFEEVNLRFYVRHFDGTDWKRGVSFVSEIVPLPLVARIANTFYNEHYAAARMRHAVQETPDTLMLQYDWNVQQKGWNRMFVKAANTLQPMQPGSEAHFIFEHYYGFNRLNKNTSIAYTVAHPAWQVYPVLEARLDCDIAATYGREWVPFLSKPPRSVFLAQGSAVSVQFPRKISI